jgi:hypothetical protein
MDQPKNTAGDSGLDHIDLVIDTMDNIACPISVEEAQRQPDDMRKQITAHIQHDVVDHPIV